MTGEKSAARWSLAGCFALASLVSLGPGRIIAQTVGLQTLTNPAGYTYQVQNDWVAGAITDATETYMGSTAQAEDAYVLVRSPSGATASDMAQSLLTSTLTAGVSQSSYVVTDPSSPVQVPGADAAAGGAATFADQSGTPGQEYIIAAVRGAQGYALIVDVPAAVDAATPSLAQTILASFRLTAATSNAPSPSSSPAPATATPAAAAAARGAVTTTPPSGVTVAPSGTDPGDNVVTDTGLFEFAIGTDWSFDATPVTGGGFRMLANDGNRRLTVSVQGSPNGTADAGDAATGVLQTLQQQDAQSNSGYQQQLPPNSYAGDGWDSIGTASDRFTGADGVTHMHYYAVGMSGGLTVTLDESWTTAPPPSARLVHNLFYIGGS